MHERLRAAEGRPGWVAGRLLRPVDRPHDRVIVGTWDSREHWTAWHEVVEEHRLAARRPIA